MISEIPEWLAVETFAVQHCPNCPKPYLVRLIARGRGILDLKPYCGDPSNLTRDVLGFGLTLQEAAEAARAARVSPSS